MKQDLETTIHTQERTSVSVDRWDDGVWLSIQLHAGSARTILTREEATRLVQGLQAILASEVEA